MTQSECFAESGWSNPQFWQQGQREKIRVCKLNDSSLQVQLVTETLTQQLFSFFSTTSHWTFFIIASGPSLKGDLSLKQQEEIQTILSANKPFSQIKQDIIDKISGQTGLVGSTRQNRPEEKVNDSHPVCPESPICPESPVCPVPPDLPTIKRSKRLESQGKAYEDKVYELEEAIEVLQDDIDSWEEGDWYYACDWSPIFNRYKAVSEAASGFDDPVWKTNMRKEIEFLKENAPFIQKSFLDLAEKNVQIELQASYACLWAARKKELERRRDLQFKVPGTSEIPTLEWEQQLTCWRAFLDSHQQLLTILEDTSKQLPDDVHLQESLARQRAIRKEMDKKQALLPKATRDLPADINAQKVRDNRVSYKEDLKTSPTDNKKKIKKTGKKASKWKRNLFFTYLQLWGSFGPAFNPGTRFPLPQDNDIRMAKAKEEGRTHDYQRAAVERAWFAETRDFLPQYEQLLSTPFQLRNWGLESLFPTQPAADNSPVVPFDFTHAAATSSTGISMWLSTFLGRTKESHFLDNASELEKWSYHHRYPQYREQVMEEMRTHFEGSTIPPVPPLPLYDHFYQMYQSASQGDFGEKYQAGLTAAQTFQKYALLTKEWDVFLQDRKLAFGRSWDTIPTETMSLGKEVLRSVKHEISDLQKQILDLQKEVEHPDGKRALKNGLEKLEEAQNHIASLKKSTPVTYAERRVVKSWLEKIDHFKEQYKAILKEIHTTRIYEHYRGSISLYQVERFLEQPPLQGSSYDDESLLAVALGVQDPALSVSHGSIQSLRLQVLIQRISVLQDTTFCTTEEAADFCGEYLKNLLFANRIRHSDVLPFLQTLQKKLKTSILLSRAFTIGPHAFEPKLRSKLGELNKGDSLFFVDESDNVAYEFILERSFPGSSYTLRCYSTDPRHEIQVRVLEDGIEKLHPYREINGASLEGFFAAFRRGKHFPYKKQYEEILKDSGGTPNNVNLTPEQRVAVGHASYYQTITSLFSTQFAHGIHAVRFEFDTSFKLLSDRLKLLRQSVFLHKPALLARALTTFSASLLHWHEAKVISDQELMLANALVQEASSLVEVSLPSRNDPTPSLPISGTPTTFSVDRASLLDSIPTLLDLSSYEPRTDLSTLTPGWLDTHSIPPWDGSAKTVLSHLKVLDSFQEIENAFVILPLIQDFIKVIPLNDQVFWGEFPVTDLEPFIELIKDCSRKFFVFTSRITAATIESQLMRFKILALANQAFNQNHIPPISMHSDFMENALDNMVIRDPEWIFQLQELKKYWANLPKSALKYRVDHTMDLVYRPFENNLLDTLFEDFLPWIFNWIKTNYTSLNTQIIQALKGFEGKGEELNNSTQLHPDFIYMILSSDVDIWVGEKKLPNQPNLVPESYQNLKTIFINIHKAGELQLKKVELRGSFIETVGPSWDFIRDPIKQTFKIEDYLSDTSAQVLNLFYEKKFHSEATMRQTKDNGNIMITREYINDQVRKRSPTNRVLSETSNYPENIRFLASDETTQVHSTLRYFSRIIPELNHLINLQALQFLLFERDLLIQELIRKDPEDNQEWIEDFTAFWTRAIHYYEAEGKFAVPSALLKMTHAFNRIVKETYHRYPEKFPDKEPKGLYDAHAKFKSLLNGQKLSQNEKGLVNYNFYQSFRTNTITTKEQLVELITAALWENIHDTSLEIKEQLDVLKPSNLLEEKIHQIHRIIREQPSTEWLNEIYQHIFPSAEPTTWQSAFPRYRNADNTIEIDVLTGTITESNQQLRFLPESLLKHNEFKKSFGVLTNVACTKKGVQKTVNEKKWNIEIYTFREKQNRQCRLIQYEVNSKKGVYAWLTQFGENWYAQQDDVPEAIKKALPPIVQYNHQYWTSKNGETLILLTENDTGLLKYTVSDSSIFRVDEHGKPTQDVLIDLRQSSEHTSFLQSLEDPKWIAAFKDQTTEELSFLSLPRFGLTFFTTTIDGERRLESAEHPGKILAKQQRIPELAHLESYLILEELGKPSSIFVPHPSHSKEFTKRTGTLFKWNPTTKELIAETDADRFHLAGAKLQYGDYRSAEKWLLQKQESIKPYDERTKDRLHFITSIQSTHPRVEALQLKARALLFKDAYDVLKKPNKELLNGQEKDLERYVRYLQTRKSTDVRALTRAEERMLIRLVFAPMLKPETHLGHRLVLMRMQKLGIPLSEQQKNFLHGEPVVDPLNPTSRPVFKPSLSMKKQPSRRTFDFSIPTSIIEVPLDFSEVLEEVSLSDEKLQKLNSLQETLKNQPALNETLANNKLKNITDEVNVYVKGKITSHSYQIRSLAAIKQTRKSLKKEVDVLQAEAEALKAQILQLAKQPSSNPKEAARQQTRLLAEQISPITFEKTLLSFLKHDPSILLKYNPSLTDKQLTDIYQALHTYLMKSTRSNHLKSIITKLTEIKGLAKDTPLKDLESQATQLAHMMQLKRAYDPQQDPIFLGFEYHVHFRLRPDQIKAVKDLRIVNGKITQPQHLGKVIQLIMGAGKTSAIIPLLCMLHADGQKLVIAMLPKGLIQSMWGEFQEQIKDYDQWLTFMEFDRDSTFDQTQLQRILDRFQDIRESKKVLVVAGESIKALFLKMAEMLKEYQILKKQERDTAELTTTLPLFFQIFRELRESGITIIDEIDFILDVLRSFHYTIGAHDPFFSVPSEASHELYRYLYSNKGTLKHLTSNEHTLTSSLYHEMIKPQLLTAILKGEIGNAKFTAFMNGLSLIEKNNVERFLKRDFSPDVLAYMESLDPVNNSKEGQEIQDILATYMEQINELLPLTLIKKLFRDYGPSPDILKGEDNLLGFLYDLGRPAPPQTQFGTELETINYTNQLFLNKGFTTEEVRALIRMVLNRILQYQQQYPQIKKEEIRDYQLLQALTNGLNLGLEKINDEQLKILTEAINSDPNQILNVVLHFILPEMKIYLNQLNADAQLFGLLFQSILGLSGTVRNAPTFTPMISEVTRSNANVEALSLIWNNDPVIGIPSVDGQLGRVKAAVEKIVSAQGKKGPCSIIDIGNVFGGIDNIEVAKALYEYAATHADKAGWKEITAVVYYDQNDDLMVIKKFNGDWMLPVKFDKRKFQLKELLAYWDLGHARGSNVILSPTMLAGVTLHPELLFDETAQGVFRLRDLPAQQKVHFVATHADLQAIKEGVHKLTGEPVAGDLFFKEAFLHILAKEAKRQGRDNTRAFTQQLSAIALDKIIKGILDSKELDQSVEIFSIGLSLFETKQERRPYRLLVHPSIEADKETVMKREIHDFLNSDLVQKIKDHPQLSKHASTIDKETQDLYNKQFSNLPDTIQSGTSYGTSTQKSTATQTLQQIHMQTPQLKPAKKPYSAPKKSTKTVLNLKIDPWKWQPVHYNYLYANWQPAQEALKAPYFDPQLMCSANLCPYGYNWGTWWTSGWDILHAFSGPAPFNRYQKECHQLLVLKEKATAKHKAKEEEKLRVIMLDQNDEKQIKELFQHEDLSSSSHYHLLYDLSTGAYMQGKGERLNVNELEKDPAFQRLKIQAKLFSGKLIYTPQELIEFKAWLKDIELGQGRIKLQKQFEEEAWNEKETNKDLIKKLIVEKILPWAGISKEEFEDSPLGNLFAQ